MTYTHNFSVLIRWPFCKWIPLFTKFPIGLLAWIDFWCYSVMKPSANETSVSTFSEAVLVMQQVLKSESSCHGRHVQDLANFNLCLNFQRPGARELLKHSFIRRAQKTANLVDLIDQYQNWQASGQESPGYGSEGSDGRWVGGGAYLQASALIGRSLKVFYWCIVRIKCLGFNFCVPMWSTTADHHGR
jgi:hypothetical protein